MARAWLEDRTRHASYRAARDKAKTEKREPPGRWRVRWYDLHGKPRTAVHARKPQAEDHIARLMQSLGDGSYRDPMAGRATVGEVAEAWLVAQANLTRSSRSRYRGLLDTHVLPRWSGVAVAKVRFEDVAGWVAELGRAGAGPATVKGAHRVLHMTLGWGVRTGAVATNAAAGVPLPRSTANDHVYLTYQQLDRLADACQSYRLLILIAGLCGLRWGEVSALRVGRVDLAAGRLHVVEAFAKTATETYLDTPKDHERRAVPLPGSLASELAEAVEGRGEAEWLFTSARAKPLRYANFRSRVFAPAIHTSGLDHLDGLRLHSLRHTAASLAIAAGADVKSVQAMLGHASAAMTLDRYSHLFTDHLDDVALRMDAARSAALHPNGG